MNANPPGEIKTLKPHVAINVRNVKRSIEFYRKLFGIEPCKAYPKYAKFDVEDPPLNLTLNERPFIDQGALFHMGIQVPSTEDVLAVRERWVRAGLSTREEMQIVCGYALQDKSWVAANHTTTGITEKIIRRGEETPCTEFPLASAARLAPEAPPVAK
ncbi:MAG: VOC family protein [Acidobacteria bacterium]|nr:VOC family protein [Acidobacteriota bacterium]